MNNIIIPILSELRHLIATLGGNSMLSPALYDTAQVLRYTPQPDTQDQTLEWLLAQQQPDGGWGDPIAPRTRDVPTIAIILALHTADSPHAHEAMRFGQAFLRAHAPQTWTDPLPEDLPVGVELLLPHLLAIASQQGIALPLTPYAGLHRLGKRRRAGIAQRKPRAGEPAVHSWEAWGTGAGLTLQDGSGSIGHSPSATAAWLCSLRTEPTTSQRQDGAMRARDYLEQAAAATQSLLPGVMPTVWPITRFEQAFSLYHLLIAGILQHPALQSVIQAQAAQLAHALRPSGIGQSDFFRPDGDDTAVTIAILRTLGYPIDPAILDPFAIDDQYRSYPHELQPAITVTAHATHALACCGIPCPAAWQFLTNCQAADGRWKNDKWHSSWVYTTAHVMVALRVALDYNGVDPAVLHRAIAVLLMHQQPDGGWGIREATAEETAYGIIALRQVADRWPVEAALRRAEQWMLDQPLNSEARTLWIGKELYCPTRLVRILTLAATLPTMTADVRGTHPSQGQTLSVGR